MESKIINIGDKHRIGNTERCFIIAEIGQNHQGDFNIAKEMIKAAKDCGADCVKFQKTDLSSKFTRKALIRPYFSENSWGDTYGEHKAHLEFKEEEFIQLQKYAGDIGILFASSAMDIVSLHFLNSINIPFIKIGSGDVHNKPLLQEAAKLHKPLVISTGMSNINEVMDVYNTIKAEHSDFCFLHCVSSYPAPINEINLNVIKTYKNLFPDVVIGYSGHEIGTEIALAAAILEAKLIEKHFTLNKKWKGTDHICSLEPEEFKKMVEDIRLYEANKKSRDILLSDTVQVALGVFEKKFQKSEYLCYKKLGKSIVAAMDLQEGEVITNKKICIKVSEPKGIPASKFENVIGKIIKRNVRFDESIFESDIIGI